MTKVKITSSGVIDGTTVVVEREGELDVDISGVVTRIVWSIDAADYPNIPARAVLHIALPQLEVASEDVRTLVEEFAVMRELSVEDECEST